MEYYTQWPSAHKHTIALVYMYTDDDNGWHVVWAFISINARTMLIIIIPIVWTTLV